MPSFTRKAAGLFAAAFVLLSLVSFACGPPARASGADSVSTTMHSLKAGGLTRRYEVIKPGQPLPKSAPIIVMLSGISATVGQEIARDGLVPYASADEAELVYPVAVHRSWNALGCCGYAASHHVNDLAFLRALAVRLDPRHARPVYLVGYSNGGRLAYRVACTTPGVFSAYAMIKGVPLSDCVVKRPVSIVQLAATDDPEVPYAHGGRSKHEIAVLPEIRRLRTTDRCSARKVVEHAKRLTYTAWSGCADGSRLSLASWTAGGHSFPRPSASVPGGAQVIWAFFMKSPIRALPSIQNGRG